MRSLLWVLLLLARVAHGESLATTVPERGEVVLRLSVEAELSRHQMLQPLSLAPDVSVGVGRGLAVLLHSSHAATAQLDAGHGLCLVGPMHTLGMASPDCERGARGFGVSAVQRLSTRSSARAGVLDAGPREAALAGVISVGIGGQGRWVVQLTPTLLVGFTGRETGNQDRFAAPLYVGRRIHNTSVCLRSGIEGTVSTFGETFAIPLGLSVAGAIGSFELGGDISLSRAFGPLSNQGWRTATAYVQVRR
jgi:hypothetical protein